VFAGVVQAVPWLHRGPALLDGCRKAFRLIVSFKFNTLISVE
jgi:hypothetical protein